MQLIKITSPTTWTIEYPETCPPRPAEFGLVNEAGNGGGSVVSAVWFLSGVGIDAAAKLTREKANEWRMEHAEREPGLFGRL